MFDAHLLIKENINVWTTAIKKRSATGRGSNKKIELTGIKKLREFILELAVRGKLVLQDPNDEPASVLLEKIAAEKAQLIKDKKIKKPKPLPKISENEKPFELPEGWKWSRLGSLGYTQTGGTPKRSTPDHYGDYIPFIKPADILPSFVNYDNVGLSLEGSVILGRTAPKNSILMVCIGTIGKCNYINKDCTFNQQINSLTPYLDITKFIYTSVLANYFQNLAWGLSSSTTIAILNKGKWDTLPIPVPPLAEQHRIVTKVDELMGLCDQLEQQTEDSITAHKTLVETLLATLSNSENPAALTAKKGGNEGNAGAISFESNWARIAEHFDTLFTTEHSIDQLKQTILQLAVMGKLVPQNSNDEPASVLLEKIAAEKEQLIKDKKIKKQMPLPEITETEKPFKLPNGWEWVRFGYIANSRLGKMLDKAKNKGEFKPYLRNTNVQWHKFELDDIKQMKLEAGELSEFLVLPNDLLICEGGEPGRCAIWRDSSRNIYFQKAIHRARPYSDVIVEYLQLCLTVDAGTSYLDKYFTGATIKHFTSDKLNKYVLPLPSAKEQYRIVKKANELMSLCDQLKTRLNDAQTTQLHLADAIVDQAVS